MAELDSANSVKVKLLFSEGLDSSNKVNSR